MGVRTVVVIDHDHLNKTRDDPNFGKALVMAILLRGNPNDPKHNVDGRGTALGPQFHSGHSFFVSIEDGAITRLEVDEQIALGAALRRFRAKKLKKTAEHK